MDGPRARYHLPQRRAKVSSEAYTAEYAKQARLAALASVGFNAAARSHRQSQSPHKKSSPSPHSPSKRGEKSPFEQATRSPSNVRSPQANATLANSTEFFVTRSLASPVPSPSVARKQPDQTITVNLSPPQPSPKGSPVKSPPKPSYSQSPKVSSVKSPEKPRYILGKPLRECRLTVYPGRHKASKPRALRLKERRKRIRLYSYLMLWAGISQSAQMRRARLARHKKCCRLTVLAKYWALWWEHISASQTRIERFTHLLMKMAQRRANKQDQESDSSDRAQVEAKMRALAVENASLRKELKHRRGGDSDLVERLREQLTQAKKERELEVRKLEEQLMAYAQQSQMGQDTATIDNARLKQDVARLKAEIAQRKRLDDAMFHLQRQVRTQTYEQAND